METKEELINKLLRAQADMQEAYTLMDYRNEIRKRYMPYLPLKKPWSKASKSLLFLVVLITSMSVLEAILSVIAAYQMAYTAQLWGIVRLVLWSVSLVPAVFLCFLVNRKLNISYQQAVARIKQINAQRSVTNQQAETEERQVLARIQQIVNWIQPWLSQEYCCLDAITFFINALQVKADTLKEAALLYDNEKRHQEEKRDRERMLELQRWNNCLQMAQIMQNLGIQSMLGNIGSRMGGISSRMGGISSELSSINQKLRR